MRNTGSAVYMDQKQSIENKTKQKPRQNKALSDLKTSR
jgi:hypothetical protein